MVLFVSYSFAITFPSFPFTVVRQTVYSRIHDMMPKYNIKENNTSHTPTFYLLIYIQKYNIFIYYHANHIV